MPDEELLEAIDNIIYDRRSTKYGFKVSSRSHPSFSQTSDEHGRKKWLTHWPGVRYAEKQDRRGFSGNLKMLLLPLAIVRDHPAALSVSGRASRPGLRCKHHIIGKTAA